MKTSTNLCVGIYTHQNQDDFCSDKYGMILTELFSLTETRAAPLYHTMEWSKAMDVFAKDVMEARWEHNIPGMGKVMGNSFSRNSRFDFGGRIVRVVVDQAVLAQRNKIVPLDAEIVFRHDGSNLRKLKNFADRQINVRGGSAQQYAEEFVIGNINHFHRCLRVVEIGKPNFYANGSRLSFDLFENAKRYCDQFNIQFVVHPKYIEYMETVKQRWAADEESE